MDNVAPVTISTTKPERVHARLPLGAAGAKALGARIRSARLRADMRLEDLSTLSGVHRSQISRIERGLALTLTTNARRLCACLDIPLPVGGAGAPIDALTTRMADLVRQYPESAALVDRALATIERRFGVDTSGSGRR